MTTKKMMKTLQAIANEHEASIRKEVAKEALEYGDVACFFSDLARCGCVSWFIGSLIYYTDTHHFYDQHYDEIEDLRVEYEENIGMPIVIKGDLKNFFAWFAFEETAYQLSIELGLEI
jgi:hypothetical protein